MQIDNILLIMSGSYTKGNFLRLLITVVCVGWNFLVLDWQFTGDYRLYGVEVIGFPAGSFLNNHYVGYTRKFRVFFMLVLISFWKTDYVWIQLIWKFVGDLFIYPRRIIPMWDQVIRTDSSNFGPEIVYPDRFSVSTSVCPAKCQFGTSH
jgi:hypothetical protein